jgi:hypothetical protein
VGSVANDDPHRSRRMLRSTARSVKGSEQTLGLDVSRVGSGMADDCCRPTNVQMSIFAAMLSASSSSTPRYRTVLSTLV